MRNDRDRMPQWVAILTGAGDRAAAAMPQARGLRPVRYVWHMQIDLVAGFQPGPTPAGIEIGGIDPRVHLPAVHAVLDEAFAGHWGHHPEPLDRWVKQQTGSPSYDPTLWLLATQGGEPVGALTAIGSEDRGWVTSSASWRPPGGEGSGRPSCVARSPCSRVAGCGGRC